MITQGGASRRHSLIAGNLYALIWSQLRGRPYEAHANNMRVKVNATETYVYPDIVAVRGKPHFEDTRSDTLLNPAVIAEILSDETETYDRGEKFFHRRRLETLHEYVLVAQHKMRIEHYRRRDGGQWVLREISDPTARSICRPSTATSSSPPSTRKWISRPKARRPTN